MTINLIPMLPDESCCEIELDCGALACTRGLQGNTDDGGIVNDADADIIEEHVGHLVNDDTCGYDFGCNGSIQAFDVPKIKPYYGNTVPDCP